LLNEFPNMQKAIINDINKELIDTYRTIAENPEQLIAILNNLQTEYHALEDQQEAKKAYYYEKRALFNSRSEEKVMQSALFIFLNRTCFNGLYRVNSKNQFNVPYGKYKNPKIIDRELIYQISDYLNENDIQILNTNFEEAVSNAKKGDFVYFDPPYIPLNETSSFTSYTHEGFTYEEQLRLRNVFEQLNRKGIYVMLSNSSSPLALDLYQDYNIHFVDAVRTNGAKTESRKKIKEIIVTNYDE